MLSLLSLAVEAQDALARHFTNLKKNDQQGQTSNFCFKKAITLDVNCTTVAPELLQAAHE